MEVVQISSLVYDGDRSVSPEGLVTPGADYASYTGSDLFAAKSAAELIADIPEGVQLSCEFDGSSWFIHEDEAAAIVADMSGVEVTASFTKELSTAEANENVGTAVFSYYGQPDMMAELVVMGDAATEVSSSDPQPDSAEISGADVQSEKPNDTVTEDTCSSMVGVLAVVSVLGMVVAAVLFFVKKRA